MNPQNSPNPSAPVGGTGPGGGAPPSGGTLTDTKHKVADAARDAASKVKTAATETAAKAKQQAQRIVSDKKETAANRIDDYSSAIHESARSLEEKDPNIAWFTHRAADKLQNVADCLRNSDWNAVRGGCESFARQHPMAFFGGLFFAGLVLGNIIKASGGKVRDYSDDGIGGPTEPEQVPSGLLQADEELPTPTPSMGM